MVGKVLNIIVGTFNNLFGIMPSFGRSRMRKCMGCAHVRNGKVLGYRCSRCGCILRSKVTVRDEKCPIGVW